MMNTKIKLNVGERLTLIRIIPEKGNFDTMTTVEKLKKVLFLSEEETKEFGIKEEASEIPLNDLTTERREVEIGEIGFALIMKSLEKLDKEEKLDVSQYSIYKYLKEIKEQEEKIE